MTTGRHKYAGSAEASESTEAGTVSEGGTAAEAGTASEGKVFDGAPTRSGMDDALTVDRVVVPVDGSEESLRAVEYAVAVADRYEATLHVVYVLGEEVVRAIETDSVDHEDVAAETEAFTDTVRERCEAAGVPISTALAHGFSTRRKTTHPGSAILDTAEEVDADFIVVPREPVAGEPGEVLEKAAEYVLLYASQPVLSV